MRNHTELLDLAYKYLEQKKKSSFKDIWNYLQKELEISEEEKEKVVGNLYTGMVLDPHFFLKNDKLWYTRDQVTLDEFKSQVSLVQTDETIDLDYSVDDSETKTSLLKDDYEEEDLIPLEDEYEDGDKEQLQDIDLVYKKALNEEFE